ncbi:ricin-type beta-trefoil lectin domain protein [Kitasatospora sp. NPDC086009]|uniref:ricin-type beta-trefoil lectin domain protein n=1 Tax=unclassified Kitasatospora TaxID=2633591 RepID=UPI0037C9642A
MADRHHGPADPSWPAHPAKPAQGEQAAAVAKAMAQAKSTGKPVVVDRLTSAGSLTSANPDGTLTTDSSPVAERVRNNDGTWRAIDATLRTASDGTLTPAAVPSALTFSGGGKGPMATMTTSDGKKLAFKAPFDLPKPQLDGDSALYRSVLPDVDLQLSATAAGGWRQVLIVRTVTAAADPRVKQLHLDVSGDGLMVKADTHGNLTAEDAEGKVRFTAPVPVMWDSAAAPAAAQPTTLGKSAEAPQADSTTGPVPSSAEAPGDHAKIAPVATTVSGSGIDLVPDTTVLGQGTGPWYIDPGWNPSVDNGAQAWAQVQEGWPDNPEYNGTVYDQDKPAAGYCDYVDSANPCERKGRERAYFQLGLGSQFWNSTVLNATLYANVVRSSSPSTSTPMNLYSTGSGNDNPINQWTRWNAQPCGKGPIGAACSKITTTWLKGTGGVEFDVTSLMARAAAEKWGGWTFAFSPDDETNKYYRQRFANNPHVVVTYDIAPLVSTPATSPTPGFAEDAVFDACKTRGTVNPWENPGWIGANTDINISADTWSPTGQQLWTTFKIWDDDDGGSSKTYETGWGAGSGRVNFDVGSLIDGHQYGWYGVTDDGTLHSGNTDMCFLRIDRTPPTARITSTDFPESGTLGGHPKLVGQEGTFTLTGTDSAPATGGRSSGLACARWTADPVQAAATGWNCNDGGNIVKMNGAGAYQLSLTPWRWGTNFLYLQTQDNAGNMSQPVAYTYYVPHNPAGPAPVYGDLDYDSNPDVLLPDGAGNLRLTGAGTDPHSAAGALNAGAPGGGGWEGVDVTHRGSFTDQNYDDLIAHVPGDPIARLYANDGIVGRFDSQANVELLKPTECMLADATPISCADYGAGTNWSTVTQIAAFGSPEGDTPIKRGTGLLGLPRTSVLYIDNGRLWLARADGTQQLGSAFLLSQNNQDWSSYDLIAPGPAKGSDTPTLWTRSKVDGTIHAYAFKKNGSTFDAAAFADPAQGWIGGGFDAKLYPKVGSDGDLTGDGIPDLWAVDTNKQLVVWSGVGSTSAGTPKSGPTVTGLAAEPVVLGNLNRPIGNWLAAPNGTDSVTDGQGRTNAHADRVGWVQDTVGGRSTTVARFGPADSSVITMSGPVVDTRKSFTVSSWAKSGSGGGVVASQDTAHGSNFMLYSEGAGRNWAFALAYGDDDNWPYHWTSGTNASAAVRPGVWTRLTASYNAGTGLMSLYVDGVLAATGYHRSNESPPSSGPFMLGRYKYQSAASTSFDGSISGTAVYPFAVGPAASGARSTVQSAINPSMCADDAGFGTADGTPIQLWDCHGDTSQQFSLGNDGTVRVLGGCLTPVGAGRDNGVKMEYRTCNGTESQKWIPLADNTLFHPDSGRCLDLPGWSATNGNRLQLWDCHPGASQQWIVSALRTAVLPAPPLS